MERYLIQYNRGFSDEVVPYVLLTLKLNVYKCAFVKSRPFSQFCKYND